MKNKLRALKGGVRKEIVYAMEVPIQCTTNIPKPILTKWLDGEFRNIEEYKNFERKLDKGEYFIKF